MNRLIVVEFNDRNRAVEYGKFLGELVRCKECKNAYMTYDGRCKYCEKRKDDDDNYLELYLDGEYYCADGKRKEGE